MLYSIVGILVIILDQATKFWVSNTLFGSDVVRFIPGVISLVNVHNDGAAFSFLSGSDARIYFIVATGVFTLLVVIALATNFIRGKFSRWCLVFVAAGGLGNMIDRIIYGYVQDMFKVELFNFAIFNVADVFITVFAILFALAMIFERPENDLNDVLYEDDEEELEEKARKKQEKREKKQARKDKKQEETAPAREDAAPATPAKRAVSSARKARQDKYEQEYEEYKAQQRAALGKKDARRQAPAPAPAIEAEKTAYDQLKAKAAEPDPFAAWEQAQVKAENSEASSYAGRLMNAPKTAPAQRPAPAAKPAPAPAPKPEAPKSAAKPAEPKKPAAADEEFSLEDILAEFK
ncbi:MAG: signal peptidase II [Oscillospiraceae bacterium]|nr:signal peptidase II [Oscillospiraceae bacterium]